MQSQRWLAVWRSGSVVRRTKEVTPRRARLVLAWVTVYGRVYYLGMYSLSSQLGQLSLASLCDR